ncbi:hypothetical protein LZ30DRAFT_51783 [Colletotrichum cereale]|nr:hypothetical protein LZ30DRAFT_51783 [Colletotrichum cereale]
MGLSRASGFDNHETPPLSLPSTKPIQAKPTNSNLFSGHRLCFPGSARGGGLLRLRFLGARLPASPHGLLTEIQGRDHWLLSFLWPPSPETEITEPQEAPMQCAGDGVGCQSVVNSQLAETSWSGPHSPATAFRHPPAETRFPCTPAFPIHLCLSTFT